MKPLPLKTPEEQNMVRIYGKKWYQFSHEVKKTLLKHKDKFYK